MEALLKKATQEVKAALFFKEKVLILKLYIETPILNITANAHRDWTNRKKVGYSDQKNKKNVTFYTPQVSNREYGPHSSRSSIGRLLLIF